MFSPDQDLDHVPRQLLIRARSVRELDSIIASRVVAIVRTYASTASAAKVAEAAHGVLARQVRDKAGVAGVPSRQVAATHRLDVLTAFADDYDRCGHDMRQIAALLAWLRHHPHPVPPDPGPDPWDVLGDPIALIAFDRARALVGVGSPELREAMLPVLQG